MGNFVAFCKPNSIPCNIIKIAKEDGKILVFTPPIHVNDILTNFPANSISISKNGTEILSQDHELKSGKFYYLIPQNKETEPEGGIKRIKVLITKQQLQQLVSEEISLQDLLSSVVRTDGVDLRCEKKHILDSIPEENE